MKGVCESYYNYRVHDFRTGDILRFKMVKPILEKYNMSRSSVYKLINNNPPKCFDYLKIFKIKEPAFELKEIKYYTPTSSSSISRSA